MTVNKINAFIGSISCGFVSEKKRVTLEHKLFGHDKVRKIIRNMYISSLIYIYMIHIYVFQVSVMKFRQPKKFALLSAKAI